MRPEKAAREFGSDPEPALRFLQSFAKPDASRSSSEKHQAFYSAISEFYNRVESGILPVAEPGRYGKEALAPAAVIVADQHVEAESGPARLFRKPDGRQWNARFVDGQFPRFVAGSLKPDAGGGLPRFSPIRHAPQENLAASRISPDQADLPIPRLPGSARASCTLSPFQKIFIAPPVMRLIAPAPRMTRPMPRCA